MKLVRGIHNIKKKHKGCILTIGNFDSVHIGHQELLKYLKNESKNFNLKSMIMIFEPQPLEFFLTNKAPARLSRFRDKIKYFSEYNIDYVLCVKFNQKIASLTAKSFVYEILIQKLRVKCLITGSDFCFGRNKEGNIKYLLNISKKYNFKMINIKRIYKFGKKISSTNIRKALFFNNFKLAECLMGHPYRLSGRVVYGKRIGSVIGFPTANILFKCLVIPIHGVYVVKVYGLRNKFYPAVANIGKRPTVHGINQQIEVHLIDVSMNIYKRHIDIVFLKKIRNEEKFSSIRALKSRITRDIESARNFFNFYK